MSSQFKTRYKLTPQMRDYDLLAMAWLPYVMYFHQPDYSSEAIHTDRFGFRHSLDRDGNLLTLDTLKGRESNLLVGGSTAFGVGATSDGKTISARLSDICGDDWLNFGARAYNSTQELFLALSHSNTLTGGLRKIVLFCIPGANIKF